ncbi:MAG: hypothetical protein NC221_07630 [Duncaniella sp.]|nr:hypothetical protein [Duncaniella sp.]
MPSTDVDDVGVLQDLFKRLAVNFDGIPNAIVTRYHIKDFSLCVVVGVLVLDLIDRVSICILFEFKKPEWGNPQHEYHKNYRPLQNKRSC